MNKKFILIEMLLLIVSWFLIGCAGLEVAMEHSKVEVLSSLDNVPFFDSHPGQKVYVNVKNFSSFQDLAMVDEIVKQKYQQRGFVVVNNPEQADWVVQAKIVNIEKKDITARELKGTSSEQGGVTGATAGALAGGAAGNDVKSALVGALIGGVLTGTANLTVNSWVKLGYLTIITDIQVKERKNVFVERTGTNQIGNVQEKIEQEEQENWIKYRFQALTRAKKANLKWEDCKDAMIQEISRIISSLL